MTHPEGLWEGQSAQPEPCLSTLGSAHLPELQTPSTRGRGRGLLAVGCQARPPALTLRSVQGCLVNFALWSSQNVWLQRAGSKQRDRSWAPCWALTGSQRRGAESAQRGLRRGRPPSSFRVCWVRGEAGTSEGLSGRVPLLGAGEAGDLQRPAVQGQGQEGGTHCPPSGHSCFAEGDSQTDIPQPCCA